tara:strand:+ start:31 stop:489 length:459 start_codon:yes stop_codon:yes gene_type:complete
MKKSQLRKIIREVIKEQFDPTADWESSSSGGIPPTGPEGNFLGLYNLTEHGIKCYVCTDSLPPDVLNAIQAVGFPPLSYTGLGLQLYPPILQSPSFFGDNNSDCYVPVGLSTKVLQIDLGLNPSGGNIAIGGSTTPLDCRKPSGVGPVSPRG